MPGLNSFELFEKNPRIHSAFPLLVLDVNNHHCVPQRLRFHEMHWHDDLQLTFVMEGVIQIKSLYQTLELKKGESAFINRKILHQITEKEDAHYQSLLFPDVFMKFYENSPVYRQVVQFLDNHNLTTVLIQDRTMMDIIERMRAQIARKEDPFYEYEMLLLMNQFILELMKRTEIPEKKVRAEQNLCIQKCLTFIHDHYDEDITLEQIAAYGHISAGYCGRLFRNVLKTSPYEYLIDFRIKKSLDLLSSNEYTISRIAGLVGFNSLSHYIQCFKKRLNTTPKQYQKALFRRET